VKRKKLNLFVEGDSYHTMIQVRNLRKARQYEYFNLADPDYQPAPKRVGPTPLKSVAIPQRAPHAGARRLTCTHARRVQWSTSGTTTRR